jgi:hypothetical protein
VVDRVKVIPNVLLAPAAINGFGVWHEPTSPATQVFIVIRDRRVSRKMADLDDARTLPAENGAAGSRRGNERRM